MPRKSSSGKRPTGISDLALKDTQKISLCEVLDRVLNKGIVLTGEATISVADIDLIYLGLQMVLTSIEARQQGSHSLPLALPTSACLGEENPHAVA